MPEFHKRGYENFKLMSLLFAAQVLIGVMPVVLLLVYVGFSLYTNPIIGWIFIAVMIVSAGFNIGISKRYNVLLSGFKGEKSLIRTVKKLGSGYSVFTNLPIRYKKNRSEIDMLIIGPEYIIIVEAKNHSGKIFGKHKDEHWTQRKVYRDGKISEVQMKNPLKQMRRQRDILKSILKANDMDMWVDTVLYFSSPQVRLYLDLFDNDNVCRGEKELCEFLSSYKSGYKFSKEQIAAVTEYLNDFCKG